MLVSSVEVFDPVAGRWFDFPGSQADGIARVDLAMLYTMT
jgi:hypothetical protein